MGNGGVEREKGERRNVLKSINSSLTPLAKRRPLLARAVQSLISTTASLYMSYKLPLTPFSRKKM